MQISIAKQFSDTPGGRFISDGKFSGEQFRKELLLPAIETGENVVIDLEGVLGLPPSFLEEAFGGLIRSGVSVNRLSRQLTIAWRSPRYERYNALIWSFIDTAASQIHKRVG